MAERYRRILSIEEMYFQEESPLLLEKAALLFDQQKEINIFQAKFINIQSTPIAAVYVDISCFDIAGKSLGTVQGIYLDMDVQQNFSFGSNVPVEIPYVDARKFAFKITKIVYTNGNINEPRLPMHSIPQVESLNASYPHIEQYVREVSLLNPRVKCKNILIENKEYWICPCGTLNAKKNKMCRNCDLNIDKLTKLSDRSYLDQRHMEYEEEVRRKKQIKQQEEEARLREIHIRNKKLVKIFSVCAVVLVVVFLLANYVVFPQYYSSKAEEYINDKDFGSADKTYQKITSQLRKSKELDGYYNYCIKFLGENDIDSAEQCYTKIQDTERAKDNKLNNLWKEACIKAANNNDQDNMISYYSHIKNQDILENKELNDTFMECGKKLLIDMDFENAEALYLSKVTDNYSTSLENIYYESAKQLIDKGNYIEAIDNCFNYISAEHLAELSNNLKNAYILSLDKSPWNSNRLSKIEKYLSQENISSIKKTLYSKGKKNLNINGTNTFSENCFAQLKNYKDSNEYNKLLKVISNENLTERYKALRKMKIPFAKKYIKENDALGKYREICGNWMTNGGSGWGWVITVNISMDKGAHIIYYFDESDYRKGKKFSDNIEDICYKSNELYESFWDHKITLTASGKLKLRFDDNSGSYTCSRR